MKQNNANFISRLLAYIIDIIIISFIANIISLPFTDSNSIVNINNEINNVVNNFQIGEITYVSYFSNISMLLYQLTKLNGIYIFTTIFLNILYFVLFQFYNGGQTIGKKLFKIKTVFENNVSGINALIFKSCIINFLILNLVELLIVSICNDDKLFTSCVFCIETIQYLLIFISALFILFRKDKRGLHDIITKTSVIKI